MSRLLTSGIAGLALIALASPAWATRTTPPPSVTPGCGNVASGNASSDQPEDTVMRIELQYFDEDLQEWVTIDWKTKIRKNSSNDGPGQPSPDNPISASITANAGKKGRYRTKVSFHHWVDANGDGKVNAGETTENPGSPQYSTETVF